MAALIDVLMSVGFMRKRSGAAFRRRDRVWPKPTNPRATVAQVEVSGTPATTDVSVNNTFIAVPGPPI